MLRLGWPEELEALMKSRRAFAMLVVLVAAGVGACGDDAARKQPEPAPAPVLLAGEPKDFAFDGTTALPEGSESFGGRWQVRQEQGAASPPNAICQTETATFPALALSQGGYGDLVMSARFKAVSGSKDRAAGLIFRVRDSANYYILRANALEGNVNLYAYMNGKRSTIKEGAAPVPSGEWHELSVDVRGSRVTGQLDGRTVLTVDDTTFTGSGRVGLWTKADSVTCFDDVRVRPQ